jgi:predicted metal-dependent HD superfamily phosphohydrolase
VLSFNGFDAESRWAESWGLLGLQPPKWELLLQVMAGYEDAGRFYHTVQHLAECFGRFDEGRELAERAGEVALALWFHDAVYDTRRADNESESAAWAARAVHEAGGDDEVADRIGRLVLATAHSSLPAAGDPSLIVDIDLAILGADPPRYDQYETQIRREYAWVPEPEFRSRRRQILAGFLERSFIYSTTFFRRRLEPAARANLARAVARLGVAG